MYFKKTHCQNCGHIHDELLDYCPLCGMRNEVNQDFKRTHPMAIIPWYRELMVALLGLFGFTVFNIIFSLVFNNAYYEDASRGMMLINTASYLAFFVFVIVLVFPYFREFKRSSKLISAYLFGLLGFAVLISFSVSYGLLIDVLRPETGTGGNQSAVNDMVLRYPLISVFIVGIIGPICEEVAYRVGLFSLFRRVHPSLAYIGTAFIFGMIHFDFTSTDLVTELIYLVDYMFAGACFSFLYEKRGFTCSTVAHMFNNLFSILMILVSTQV